MAGCEKNNSRFPSTQCLVPKRNNRPRSIGVNNGGEDDLSKPPRILTAVAPPVSKPAADRFIAHFMRLMYNEACPRAPDRGTRSGDSAPEDVDRADNRKCRYSGTHFKGENEGFVREGLISSNGEVGTRFSFKKEGSLRNWRIVLYKLRAEVYHPLAKTL